MRDCVVVDGVGAGVVVGVGASAGIGGVGLGVVSVDVGAVRSGIGIRVDQGRAYVGTTCEVEETTRGSPGSGSARVRGGRERDASREAKARGGPEQWHEAGRQAEGGASAGKNGG